MSEAIEEGGEHRHMVGGAMRAHIPVSQLRSGEVVFVVPRDAITPRAAKLGPISPDGQLMAVSDYILGCAQRGAVTCYQAEGEALPEPHPVDDKGGAQ